MKKGLPVNNATVNPGAPCETLIQRIAMHKNALTLREFAELYSIGYKTAFTWATRGEIPAIQIGSLWRIDPVELIRWIEEKQVNSVARAYRSSGRTPRTVAPPMKTLKEHAPEPKVAPTQTQKHVRNVRQLENMRLRLDTLNRRIAQNERERGPEESADRKPGRRHFNRFANR